MTATPEPRMTAMPQPGMSATPEPGVTATPEPGVTATHEPGVTATHEPGVTATHEPGMSATHEPAVTATHEPGVTATPQPEMSAMPAGMTATPESGVTATPEPGVTVTPEPGTATPQPGAANGPPTISGHHDALDGVRAVAALAVLLFHVAASTGHVTGAGAASWLLSRGEIGVPVFFTLSGLLLYRPWAYALLAGHAPPRLRPYLVKRALRVLPAYWLVVAVALATYHRERIADPRTWAELPTLTYSFDAHPWWGNYLGPKGLGQMWSLTVEVAWYVLLPPTAAVLAWYARRRGPAGTAVAEIDRRARRLLLGIGAYAAASFVYSIFMFVPRNTPILGMWLPRYLAWFAIGMALAVVSIWAHLGGGGPARFARTVSASWGLCWTAAALCYCIAATPLTGASRLFVDNAWVGEFHLLLYGLVAALFVGPVALSPPGHRAIRGVLGNGVMRYLGKISYSVFLWQFVVIYSWFALIHRAPFTGNLLLDLPVCTGLTVAAAALSHHLVERPAYRLAHPRGERRARRRGRPRRSGPEPAR